VLSLRHLVASVASLAFASLFCVSTSLFCINTAHAQSSSLQLRGKVTDSADGKPIQGATVSIDGGLARYDAVTDSAGTFRLLLLPQVLPGSALRIRVQSPSHQSYERDVAASADVLVDVSLVRIVKPPKPLRRIESVILLKPHPKDMTRRAFEVIVSNNSSEMLRISKLVVQLELKRVLQGMTGFVRKLDYALAIDSMMSNAIVGRADASSNEGFGYPMTGEYGYEKSTGDGWIWRASLSAPLLLNLDSKDRVAVRIQLVSPQFTETEKDMDSGVGAYTSSQEISRRFRVTLVADNGEALSWTGDDLTLLVWLASHLPPQERTVILDELKTAIATGNKSIMHLPRYKP
jgi:hypothetical protein